MTLSEELTWRGFVNQTTLKSLNQLDKGQLTFYHGYDASSDSLTIGNLAALMMDKCFIKHGHQAVLLAGGATSLIGDPGGKDSERQLQSAEAITTNVQKISQQIEQLLGDKTKMVNNLDWFGGMNVLEFLRDVGKHFSMTALAQRDYIAKRMGEGGSGISYAEFSYTLLQGYDFLRLHEDYGATLQLAGSDQWGNGLSGVDLVRRAKGEEVNVLTCPLILNKATGKKFGKSEDGAIWLDANKTSVYKFYQYWLNVDDEGAEDYLKVFTELDKAEIDRIAKEFNENRGQRLAQKTLAFEATKLAHGLPAAESQKRIADVLFGGEDSLELGPEEFAVLKKELPVARVPKQMTQEHLLDALTQTGLASSKTEGRRFIEEGAIYINNKKMPENFHFDSLSASAVMVRRGKNNFAIVELG